MKARDISSLVEDFAPTSLASSWDNVGWQVGDTERTVGAVLLTVDFDFSVLKEAVRLGANMIVSHHPFFFKPISRIDVTTHQGSQIASLIRHDISLYSAHTNLDVAAEGVSFALAARLGLEHIQPLRLLTEGQVARENEPSTPNLERVLGWGAVGETSKELSTGELVELVRQKLGDPVVRVVQGEHQNHRTLAVCGGSGSDFIADAAHKATAYITSDVRYHQAQDCERLGLTLIDVPHYNTERPVLEVLADFLRNSLSVPVYVSQVVTSPYDGMSQKPI